MHHEEVASALLMGDTLAPLASMGVAVGLWSAGVYVLAALLVWLPARVWTRLRARARGQP